MYQSSLIKITACIENLHQVTELDLYLYQYSKIPLSHNLGNRSLLFCMLTAKTKGVLVVCCQVIDTNGLNVPYREIW